MRKMKLLQIVGLAGLLVAGTAHTMEKDYQLPWCQAVGGEAEHVLSDRTRVDCLTEAHAIEFDFAKKWAESIGQALYYAAETGRRAGIVLIMTRPDDDRYLRRLRRAIAYHQLPIDVWTVTTTP